MPLFECSKCKVVENTALGNFWSRVYREHQPPLCSECSEGKWHDEFPKQTVDEGGFVHTVNGYLFRPDEIELGGYFHGKYHRCFCSDVQRHYRDDEPGI